MGGYAWVTLATNDAYSLGALVLAHSLRRVGTQHELAILITPGVTETMREKLRAVFSLVQEVNILDSKDEANLSLLARPELGITFTKLHCWRLTQYEKCVFVDADTLVVQNCDELFEREELSAAPDVGWPDCFNSGVFVYKPSLETFASITSFAAAQGSFDGGDQGLLNMYFSDWPRKDISKHLPFIYNMCSTATYSYLPAFKQFGEGVKIIHFIGITKPWLQYFDTLTGLVRPPAGAEHLQPLLQLWWNIFCEKVHAQLSPSMAGLAGALAQLTLGQPRSAEQIALEEHMRKQSWEQGQIDYMGRDSFDNIWKKICETLSLAPLRQPTPPKDVDDVPVEKPEDVPEESIADSAAVSSDIPIVEAVAVSKEQQSLSCDDLLERSSLDETSKRESKTVSSVNKSAEELPDTKSSVSESSCLTKSSIQESTELTPEKLLTTSSSKSTEPDQTTGETSACSIASTVTEKSDELLHLLPAQKLDQPMASVVLEQEPTTECKAKDKSTEKCIEKTSETQSDVRSESQLKSMYEILSVSPVPIQVAESVLQAEPKESVSEEPRLITEEVITSVDTPVQESVAARSETLMELENLQRETPAVTAPCSQASNAVHSAVIPGVPNGIDKSTVDSQISDAIMLSKMEPLEEKSHTLGDGMKSEASETVTKDTSDTKETAQPRECATTELETGTAGTTEMKQQIDSETAREEVTTLEASKSIEVESKLEEVDAGIGMASADAAGTMVQDAPKTDMTISQSSEQIPDPQPQTTETTTTEAVPTDAIKSETATSLPATPQSEVPVRPSRSKESNTSLTITTTEATTAAVSTTSDSESSGKINKKTGKKTLKKSTSECDSTDGTEGDGTEKKIAKKAVKKVAKKPKDSTEESAASSDTSTEKAKKATKVVKKVTKTPQTPSTNPSVPDAPASGSSDAPLPPKRKIKASQPTKPAAANKPDAES